jgi:HPt (histidine-containing phosphotransfer) domain-containing protein
MNEYPQSMEQIRSHLRKVYNLDADRIQALLPDFLLALCSYLDEMETALTGSSSSREDLARAAHRVKGALANLGLRELAKDARIIEQLARQKDKAGTDREITGQVRDLVKEVRILAGRDLSRADSL